MITYAPKSITDAVKSRPDWPEIEAAMKRAYGREGRPGGTVRGYQGDEGR